MSLKRFPRYLLRLSILQPAASRDCGVRLNEEQITKMKWALQCIRPEISHMSLIELVSKDEVLKLEAIQYTL